MITIPALALLFLQNPYTQNALTNRVVKELSAALGTNIAIEHISVTFFNRLQAKNVYIEDLNGDTLLFSPKVKLTLDGISRSGKSITIRRLGLNEADIRLFADSSGKVNLQFIVDFLKKPGEKKKDKWNLSFRRIQLEDSRFRYIREGMPFISNGVDYAHMDMRQLNTSLDGLTISGDTVSFLISGLSFREKSGFTLSDLAGNMSLSNRHMDFDNISFGTPLSRVNANHIRFAFNSYKDFADFVNLVKVSFNLRSSSVDFRDIGFFAPALAGYDESFMVSGLIKGRISDMSGDRILLSYSGNTFLEASFNMIGLPDFRQTFMHFNIVNLQSNMRDLRNLNLPGNRKLILPEQLDELGLITYRGKFTGYADDFVAYGRFNTRLGALSSDLLIQPDNTLKGLILKGNIKTRGFRPGKLAKNDVMIGAVSMEAAVDGMIRDGQINANLRGIVDSLEFNGYNYRNIRLAGNFTNTTFDGAFDISDPNIQMEFKGRLDISKETPEFDFMADVGRLRPYYLNFYKKDPSYFASFLLKTNFTGNNIDNLNGNIELVNSYFENSQEQLQIYNFSLSALNGNGNNRLDISSDMADIRLIGSYQFSTLLYSMRELARHFLPSLFDDLPLPDAGTDQNDFNFDVQFKSIQPVVEFFIPWVSIANQSHVSGEFHPAGKVFVVNAHSDLIAFKEHQWKNLVLAAHSDSSGVLMRAEGSQFRLKNRMSLDNLSISSTVNRDTVYLNADWKSPGIPRYQGVLNLMANLYENKLTDNPGMKLRVMPSQLVFNDTTWNITESYLYLDSSSVKVDSFRISNQTQSFLVHGGISQQPDENLYFEFDKLDLSTLDLFTRKIKMEFDGALTGKASLKDVFNNPLLLADLYVKDVFLNEEELGSGDIRALWNNQEKKIHLLASTSRAKSEVLKIEGDYFPENGKLDFGIHFENLMLNTFYPFASEYISNIKGMGSGNLKLTGTARNPDLNGEVNLFKASLTVNYLQTRYNLSNKVVIAHNNFIFKNFEVFDLRGNKAVGDGVITTRNFREINLDLRLQTSNFAFLNTTQKDNELFYGTIFAGGLIRFTGPPANLVMDINAKSERNTIFYIPLFGTETVYEKDFIRFAGTGTEEDETGKVRYEVNLRGLTMNFNLEVTPDAEVQLIFDPKIGDIIRGRGRGNLKLSITTLGKFEIYGDILIDRGDYLFTLQNLINKKLEVVPGGRISWNGDPEDANIDLQAVYPLRTSVYALDPTRESLKKRIPVECHIHLTGKLMNPNIRPGIVLPTADEETRNIVRNSTSTEEDLMKQFLSLLIINNFLTLPGETGGGNRGSTALTSGAVATSELISNQLSQWLSQISKDFDLGVNYRPGDEITSDEVELAFSTQILNDRLRINTNLGWGGNQLIQNQSTNNLVGDFDIDFQLTESGKFHLKAFNRSNDNLLFQTSPYKQGVGVFYREDFNSFGELLGRYRDAVLRLFGSEKRKKKTD